MFRGEQLVARGTAFEAAIDQLFAYWLAFPPGLLGVDPASGEDAEQGQHEALLRGAEGLVERNGLLYVQGRDRISQSIL